MNPTKISKKGKIHTYTLNYYVPAPLDVPLCQIIADMEGGGRLTALASGIEPEEVAVEIPVELRLRRLVIERGMSVYSYKFCLPLSS